MLAADYGWTPRQREVLDLVARGKSNQEIADVLGISLDGAKWHMREILGKLGVDTREEAAEYWRRRNGLSPRFARLWRAVVAGGLLKVGGAAVGAGAIVAIGVVALLALFQGDAVSRLAPTDDVSRSTSARVVALDPVTGALTWETETTSTQIGAVARGSDVTIVGTQHEVLALDSRTGAENWRYPLSVNGFRYELPVVFKGVVVFGTDPGDWVALDVATGQEKWRLVGGSWFGTITDHTRDLFVATAGNPNAGTYRLVALDPADGNEVWSVALGQPLTSVDIAASDDQVFVTGWTRELRALDAATGETIWSVPFENYGGWLRYLHGQLLVTSSELRYPDEFTVTVALDVADGRELWRAEWKGMGPLATSEYPAANEQSLFLLTAADQISAVDPGTGQVRWSRPTNAFAHMLAVAANTDLVYLTTGDSVVALNASDGAERWRRRLTRYGTHLIPTVSDESLFMSVGGKAAPTRD